MNRALRAFLNSNAGILRRNDAVAVVDHDVLDRAVRAGQLLRPYPGILIDPDLAADRGALLRAAVRYADGRAAVSHVTGLGVWGLPVPDPPRIHLTTGPEHRLRGAQGLVVHRRTGFSAEAPHAVARDGLPVVRLERCVVDSWPMLSGDARRAPAIHAVAARMTTAERLRTALDTAPRLGGRRELARLVDMLAAGCRSELELWGYAHVFRDLRLRWQVRMMLDGRAVYLDVYDDAARVNFELDGGKYHAGTRDRERDLRRDAALAARGITVVRFTHDRLTREPDDVRRQVLAILATRRAPAWAA